jgi:hypothetical protein
MSEKIIDENTKEILNDGPAVMTVYDLVGTENEKQIVLNPGQKTIIHLKPEIEKKTIRRSFTGGNEKPA